MGNSTVRQIHAILSGTLDAAQRWDWISSNPARIARKPKQKRPEPDPPTPAEAARLSERAFEMDDDWGTLVWLAMGRGVHGDGVARGEQGKRLGGGRGVRASGELRTDEKCG
ncbi:hypothetical protein GCM10027271_22100 [Saccharopolyspora gloriosae]|uniref:Uncharacterized protein n=1 Tax=Saccharopolyspora gloriosae TaxID=455344 RepID=A0A840NNM0_9PSEU|nr:hypothetical protein [Saccharopolyspora gloriosae]MBB5070879.1 hypothetical protein [Saccharopolyspora gloriosae]